MRKLTVLVLTGLLLPMGSAIAEHPLLGSKFYLNIGDFVATKDVEIRVDGSVDVVGTKVKLASALGTSTHEDALAAEARWRFSDRWQVSAQLFRVKDRGSTTLARDIEFAGYEFRAGVDVSAEAGVEITRLFVGRDLIRDEHRAFGVGFGLHQIEISASVAGEAYVNDASVGARRASGSANGPLPNLGAWYIWAPDDRWAMTARLDWLSADVDPYDGTIINASAGVNYRLARNFGIGASYNVFSLAVGVSDTGWRGDAEITYHGPYLMVSAYW